MIEQFKKLTNEDQEILLIAPILYSVLAASWDHEISRDEKTEILNFEHIKTFSANPLLQPYYKEVENNFKKHFNETVQKYSPFNDAKREELKKEMNLLDSAILQLDTDFAKTLHLSLSAYAEHVKNAFKNNLMLNFVFPIPIPGLTENKSI